MAEAGGFCVWRPVTLAGMQLIVLIGGGIVVGVGTVFAMNWWDRTVEARRIRRVEDGDDANTASLDVPVLPADGVPHFAEDPPTASDSPTIQTSPP